MKLSFYIVVLLSALMLYTGCSDKKKIMTAWEGDKELKEGDLVPFQLYPGNPNPYNPSTAIRFEVYSAIHVKMTVYTEDWYKVKTLYDRQTDPGVYLVQFSEDIPSGEYYCVLEGGDYIQVSKIKLVK